MLTVGVTFSNAVAVLMGLFYRPSGEFERTPKKMTPSTNRHKTKQSAVSSHQSAVELGASHLVPESHKAPYRIEADWTRWAELVLAGYAFTMFGLLLVHGYSLAALPMVFYGTAYGLTGLSQFEIFRSSLWTQPVIPSLIRAAGGSADSRIS